MIDYGLRLVIVHYHDTLIVNYIINIFKRLEESRKLTVKLILTPTDDLGYPANLYKLLIRYYHLSIFYNQ